MTTDSSTHRFSQDTPTQSHVYRSVQNRYRHHMKTINVRHTLHFVNIFLFAWPQFRQQLTRQDTPTQSHVYRSVQLRYRLHMKTIKVRHTLDFVNIFLFAWLQFGPQLTSQDIATPSHVCCSVQHRYCYANRSNKMFTYMQTAPI